MSVGGGGWGRVAKLPPPHPLPADPLMEITKNENP